jgi:hypothetical protein
LLPIVSNHVTRYITLPSINLCTRKRGSTLASETVGFPHSTSPTASRYQTNRVGGLSTYCAG